MFRKSFFVLGVFLCSLIPEGVACAQGEGDKYVQESLKALLAVRTVECDLRIETFVDGKEYTARGRYEEQALPQTTLSTFLRSMYRLNIYFSMNSPIAGVAEPNRMTLVCGTSFATAQVTSMVARMFSIRPTLTLKQAFHYLKKYATQ